MMNQTNLLLLLLSMVWMQDSFVEGVNYAMGFDQGLNTGAKCTPGKMKKINDIFSDAFPGWEDWAYMDTVNDELDDLQADCNNNAGGNGNGVAWGLQKLSNDISTSELVCPSRRDLAEQDHPKAQDHPEERRLCSGDCRVWWWFPECQDMGCRRRNLREGRQLVDMQATVDFMYNECRSQNIPCIDCSTAGLCEINSDGSRGVCVSPSCNSDDSCLSS